MMLVTLTPYIPGSFGGSKLGAQRDYNLDAVKSFHVIKDQHNGHVYTVLNFGGRDLENVAESKAAILETIGAKAKTLTAVDLPKPAPRVLPPARDDHHTATGAPRAAAHTRPSEPPPSRPYVRSTVDAADAPRPTDRKPPPAADAAPTVETTTAAASTPVTKTEAPKVEVKKAKWEKK